MNINEIAKLAGVSRATVSRYLNDGYVSQEKREKISKVIEETGYEPSAQAQMLRSRKTKLIGVIIPKINSESISRMVAGIGEVLAESDYQMILADTFNDEEKELKYLNVFRENRVDGVILIGTIFTEQHKKLLREFKVPLVILGQSLDGYSCVYHDDRSAARDVTRLMMDRLNDQKKIGKAAYIGVTKRDQAAGQARYDGFCDAVTACGITMDRVVEAECGFSFEHGYNTMQRLLRDHEDIEAVFCATDSIALGAMTAARDQGYRIPEQIMFVGIGDSNMGYAVSPKLTTVHFHYKTAGIEAAQLLMQKIIDETDITKSLKMGYQLIENGTV